MAVGNPCTLLDGRPEGCYIDIKDDGVFLLININNPSPKEINAMQDNKPFKIKMTRIDGILIFTVKFDGLNWMDAPFNASLCKNFSVVNIPESNQGLSLIVGCVDYSDQVIKSLRLIGLGHDFSTKMIKEIMIEEQWSDEFDESDYYYKLNKVYAKYTTNEIVKMSKDYFNLHID